MGGLLEDYAPRNPLGPPPPPLSILWVRDPELPKIFLDSQNIVVFFWNIFWVPPWKKGWICYLILHGKDLRPREIITCNGLYPWDSFFFFTLKGLCLSIWLHGKVTHPRLLHGNSIPQEVVFDWFLLLISWQVNPLLKRKWKKCFLQLLIQTRELYSIKTLFQWW